MKKLFSTLKWRGMVKDSVYGTEEHFLQRQMVTGYIGFDPSAPSLHLGSLIPIMLLKHFQEAGHKPIVVVGGATGIIGDPSWRIQERISLTEEVLRYNVECIGKQLQDFLDFSGCQNQAELLNNLDWLRDISFIHFFR